MKNQYQYRTRRKMDSQWSTRIRILGLSSYSNNKRAEWCREANVSELDGRTGFLNLEKCFSN